MYKAAVPGNYKLQTEFITLVINNCL